MQELMGRMRAAIERYDMIAEGDRIAVGVSGGKDSIALLAGLMEMRRFYPKPYTLAAVTLDPCFSGREADYSAIAALCAANGVPYTVKRTQLGTIIFETRREANPCSLCARMRRGLLHDTAKALGCNKIALGHHLDDAAETFWMNLLRGGRVGCFSPVTYLSRKDLTMIRPLVFAREREVEAAVRRAGLPVVKSQCPADGNTQRQRVKEQFALLEREYPAPREKIVGALQRGGIDGW